MATVVKFTSQGSAIVTGLLKTSAAKYIWWGTGTTAATAADTGPETEGAEDRTTGTQDDVQTDHADDTYQVTGTITCAGTGKAITEAGVNTAADAGKCYVRATFDAVNLDVGDSIAFTFKVKHDHS